MESLSKLPHFQNRDAFLRVNAKWVHLLYPSSSSSSSLSSVQAPPLPPSQITPQYALLYEAFSDMKRQLHYPQQQQQQRHHSQQQQGSTTDDEPLKKMVLRQLGYNQNEMESVRLDVFPGPMANQLCRRNLQLIANNEYYITEKSDGIRAMMFHQYIDTFPKWSIRSSSNHSFRSCELELSLALEYHLKSGRPTSIIHYAKRKYLFNVKSMKLVEQQVQTQHNKEYSLHRSKGYGFTYFFDRNFEFYLCTSEFVFISDRCRQMLESKRSQSKQVANHGSSSSSSNNNINSEARNTSSASIPIEHISTIIADGEIVENLMEKNLYHYTIYDLARVGDEYYGDQPMHKRIEAILSLSSNHHIFNNMFRQVCLRPFLYLKRKNFFPKDKLNEILSYIQPSDKDPLKYLYRGVNFNDGLVFTPNRADLFPFHAGRSAHLLKWKWPCKLTVDFKVVPTSLDLNDQWFDLYFLIKNRDTYYRRVKLLVESESGTMSSSMQATSILQQLKQSMRGKIVECSYIVPDQFTMSGILQNGIMMMKMDPANTSSSLSSSSAKNNSLNSPLQTVYSTMDQYAMWKVDLIREDKGHGNSFTTITNTLENMIENVTEDDLQNFCLPKTNNSSVVQESTETSLLSSSNHTLQHYLDSKLDDFQAYAHFKLTKHYNKSDQYFLSYGVEVSPTKNHWYFYIGTRECKFASESVETQIRRHIEEVPDPQSTFLRCRFCSLDGKWIIVDMMGEEQGCLSSNLLRFLEFNICLISLLPPKSGDRKRKYLPSPSPIEHEENNRPQKQSRHEEYDDTW